jgi:hypothetical protein
MRQKTEVVPAVRLRSEATAERGIHTTRDLRAHVIATIEDLGRGVTTPNVMNAVSNATNKLMQVVAMEQKHGIPSSITGAKSIPLSAEAEAGTADLPDLLALRAKIDAAIKAKKTEQITDGKKRAA